MSMVLTREVSFEARNLIARSAQFSDTETLESIVAGIENGSYELLTLVGEYGDVEGVVVFRVVEHPAKRFFYVNHLAAKSWSDMAKCWDSCVVAEARKRGATSIVGGCRPVAARFFRRHLGAKQKLVVMEQGV